MWNFLIINPMINALLFIYNLLGQNFGLAIIVFTALIRLLTLPMTIQQTRSSLVMKEIQGSEKWKKIQEKYKDNKEKLSEEQMKLFQEKGYNPFGGCLGTLIQFPIILGLYQAVIRTLASSPSQLLELSTHLYAPSQALNYFPNQLIPLNSNFLWMNLGQPERWQPDFLPIAIPILTIIVVISSFIQSKLTTVDTSGEGQGAMMSNMMSIYMPVLMGYFAYTLASGLALYFVVSNLLGILQGVVMRQVRRDDSS
ncbi:MAG: membrane protein insertase YidC [Anaerolineales bacterium]|nr:membrane protein insertase YidC [Anaerolineales bacterium]